MKVNLKHSLLAVAVAAALAAPAAYATNGYFVHGNSAKSNGMGGASIAYAQDAMASASNPAGIALVGNRADFGVTLFNPLRDGQIDATRIGGADTGQVDSGATLFAIPNMGFVYNMGNITAGLSFAGNGGMNTRYNSNIYTNAFAPAIPGFVGMLSAAYPPLAGTIMQNAGALAMNPNIGPSLGVNLSQLIIAPTVATKITPDHSIGASLLVGYQSFRSYGLGLFQPLSSNPMNTTNKGDDQAWGAGVRLGWTGNITSNISLGAQYSSKIYMQEFDRYAGLFAEQGDFDIPANFGVGLSVKVTPQTTVAFDVQQIQYGDVASIANKGPNANDFLGALSSTLMTGSYAGPGQLGTDNGWGFGWDDITVYKLGIDHQLNNQWTVRGGVDIGDNPIDEDQNLFNIIAPGVVKNHVTLGFTYSPDQYSEITANYMHAFYEDQSYSYQGAGGFTGFSYDTKIGMDQNALEISYGMKF